MQQDGAMPLLSNMAANAFRSTPETNGFRSYVAPSRGSQRRTGFEKIVIALHGQTLSLQAPAVHAAEMR